MTSLTEASLRSVVPKLVPPLTGDLYKGDMGRIAVVGGCREYTGAPYFAAISALKLGADLSHVFTTKSAASVIKSYSPELIVHQSLYESESSDSNETHLADKSRDVIQSWFNRLDAIVIGPGLGQDPLNSACAKLVLRSAKEHNLPLILDADSLYLITKDRTLVQGYSEAVLTPNVNELRRLAAMMKIPTVSLTPDSNESRERIAIEVASGLCGPIIVSKGSFDVITNGEVSVRCTEPSSPRRCGGQGDVLSGSAAVFASWSKRISKLPAAAANASPLFIAAYAACLITRRAARSTFAEKGRSMVASDLIDRLASALDG